MKKLIIFSFFILSPLLSHANNDDLIYQDQYSQSTFGGIGLIQTPTARFSNDGEFAFGLSSETPYRRLYSKMQFFPWLETVLRYTENTAQPYGPGSTQTWKDKGLDLKFRLFEENNLMPGLALGFLDIGGTGAYASEYIVATKSLSNLDLSLGFGWGRLGGVDHLSNIFGWIDDSRKTRGTGTDLGGTISFDRFFSGENTSIFGGIEYFTPIENLSLKLEYDSSDYSFQERKEIKFDEVGDIFSLDSRFNYALNYRLKIGERDNVDLSLGYLRGNTLYANFAVHSNLNFSGSPKVVMGRETLRESNLEPYFDLNEEWKTYLSDKIMWELGNVGFVTHRLLYNSEELVAEISQSRFLDPSLLFDLASRILANNAPKNIKKITIINIDQGIETIRTTIDKEVLTNAVEKGLPLDSLFEYNKRLPLSNDTQIKDNEYLYPNFYWEIKPHMTGTLQHQIKYYFWQLEALIHTEYSIAKGLYFTTDIGIDITNNYDEYTYHIPDGELHHVRQNRRLYLTEGETGLRRMALDYLVDIHPNIKAKLSAGYLEWMYGGFGGEILYIPDSKDWAIGLDTFWLKQRDFDQKFSFQDYQTVTGFISYYREIPFYNMRFKLSLGRFLGKDKGALVDVSRRFNSGARVGGSVALTDCDPQCVGEGSFNKWIYFELPMDLFYIQRSTKAKTGYVWSPLTKDAGQKVEGGGGLYNLMVYTSDESDILRDKNWSVKKIFSGFGTTPKKRK